MLFLTLQVSGSTNHSGGVALIIMFAVKDRSCTLKCLEEPGQSGKLRGVGLMKDKLWCEQNDGQHLPWSSGWVRGLGLWACRLLS